MNNRLIIVMMALMFSLHLWSETPKECHEKHPNAMCMFFNTPKYDGTLEDFDIERIAIYPKTQKVAIKTTQRAKDVLKNIKDMWNNENGVLIIAFTDGSAIAVHTDNFYMIYLSTKEEKAVFKFDDYRQKLYEDIIGAYKFEGM